MATLHKIAMITGATSGIGKATAKQFAKKGYDLIITGRREDRLQEVKANLKSKYGGKILTLCFDVRDSQAVEKHLAEMDKKWKNIDVLVNNAGLAKGLAPINEGDLTHWDTMIDTNIKGLLYVTRIVSSWMVARQKGHIINIASTAGKECYPNGNVYSATKFAVDSLTKSFRLDLYKHNIRVSQVAPGHVEETEFAITRFDGDVERAKIYEDFTPLRAKDVADSIIFIATRPQHINVQDILIMSTQQASATTVDRSGRK
jgi:NADP-dependent 3-hydroxy acid dehydrogenase YdfG